MMTSRPAHWLFTPLLTIALLVWGFTAGTSRAENILFYGNSFTLGSGSTDNVPDLVQDIAVAAGHASPTVVNAASSGQDFTWHLANNTAVISNGLPVGQTWDYAVMQNFSTAPTDLGNVTQHRADSVTLYQTIAAHSPLVTPVLFETWARAPGHSFYTGPNPSFPGGPAQMQAQVRDGYQLAAGDIDIAIGSGLTRIAEVGDRWEDAAWDRLHAGDLYHAQNRGTLLAALEIYSTIYQDTTADIDLSGVLGGLGLGAVDGGFLTSIVDGIPYVAPGPIKNFDLKFDFGSASHSSGRYNTVVWNDQAVPDAIDFETGLDTGVELTLTSATGLNENGSNTSGTAAPGSPANGSFDGDATDTNLFGHTSNFNTGAPRASAEYTLTGLEPGKRYDFTFFASRLGISDNREAEYTVTGATTLSATLDAANNTDQVATITGMAPNALGEVTLHVQGGSNNTNSSGFFYLGAMRIEAIALAGDYNSDGQVDAADYTVWRDSEGAFVTPGEGADGDQSGTIDTGDFEFWRDNFGSTWPVSTSSAAVPEPRTTWMIVVAALVLSLSMKRGEAYRTALEDISR